MGEAAANDVVGASLAEIEELWAGNIERLNESRERWCSWLRDSLEQRARAGDQQALDVLADYAVAGRVFRELLTARHVNSGRIRPLAVVRPPETVVDPE